MEKYPFSARYYARAHIVDELPSDKVDKAFAAQQSLQERGEFPVGLISQPDILGLQAILLTTGRPGNLNDDVILAEEILPVLHTATLKPFNIEHDHNRNIGVMFDAFVIDKVDLSVIDLPHLDPLTATEEEAETHIDEVREVSKHLPERLDVVVNSALWRLHGEISEEVAAIKNAALAGEMFVSMEIFFATYDYLLGNRIIRRTPETEAVLDFHLKARGGSGFFGFEPLKRIPRQVIIGGVGAVENPANPGSFILDVKDHNDIIDSREMVHEESEEPVEAASAATDSVLQKYVIAVLEDDGVSQDVNSAPVVRYGEERLGKVELNENGMSEVEQVVTVSEEKKMDKIEELVEAKAELKAQLEAKQAELAAADEASDELRVRAEQAESKLEETLETLRVKETELAEATEAKEAATLAAEEATATHEEVAAQLAEIGRVRTLEARTVVLSEIGLSESRIERELVKVEELDDEAFASHVEDLKELIAELRPIEEPAEAEIKETEEPVEAPEVAEVEEEVTEVELEEVLAEAEELEEAEAAALEGAGEEIEGDDEFAQLQAAFGKALQRD